MPEPSPIYSPERLVTVSGSSGIWSIARPLAAFGAVLLAYIVIVFVLCPGNTWLGFPVHHDDFSDLSQSWNSPLKALEGPRPVWNFTIGLLSVAGLPTYYTVLHVLLVVDIWILLAVLRMILGGRPQSIFLVAVLAAACFSYENTIEYSKYTGVIPSLLSGTFGLVAMYVALLAEQRCRQGEPLRLRSIAGIWILAAFSFWSKEDFILPVVVLTAFLAWSSSRIAPQSELRRWLGLFAGVLVFAGLLAFYNKLVHSGFTQSSGPYTRDWALSSIVRTAQTYAFMSPVAELAGLLQVSTLLWNAIAERPVPWNRLLLFQAMVGALVLPYCLLPHHLAAYYPMNWIPWQIAGALILLFGMREGPLARLAVVVIAILAVAVGQQGRRSIADWYAQEGKINRNIVSTLSSNALSPYRTIVVDGAPMLGPWFATDGEFLRIRYGIDHDWIIRVPTGSDYYRTETALRASKPQSHVWTTTRDGYPVADLPIVELRSDGNGTIELPDGRKLIAGVASGLVTPAPRLDALHPSNTTVGRLFQVQPDGNSALAVAGSGFTTGDIVFWGDHPLETTYGSASLLTAIVPARLFANSGEYRVTVRNRDGQSSPPLIFNVEARAAPGDRSPKR